MTTFLEHEQDAERLGHKMSGKWAVDDSKNDGTMTFTCACIVCGRKLIIKMPENVVEGSALTERCR